MANDYTKFGRLIKINGADASKWEAYSDAKAEGNIVFADLTWEDASTTVFPAGYAPGHYIYANGVEYKVADLIRFNDFLHRFEVFEANANSSILDLSTDRNELERWRTDLNMHLETVATTAAASGSATVTIIDNDTSGSGAKNIQGFVKFNGSEYVGVGTDTDASAIKSELLTGMIAWEPTGGHDQGDFRKLTTKGYVDASLNVIDTSIRDLSTRILDTVREVRMTATQQQYNDISIALYATKETEYGSTSEVEKNHYRIQGDDYVKIHGTQDSLNLELGVWNTSIDSKNYTDTSLATVGTIKDYVDRKVHTLKNAIVLKGNVNTSTELLTKLQYSHVPADTSASKGDMYVATAEFDFTDPSVPTKTYRIESGDQIVLDSDATAETNATIFVAERNLDGAVTAKDDILGADTVVLGNGRQTLHSTEYTLGTDTDTSTVFNTSSKKLATEKAVYEYVEKSFQDISQWSNVSNAYENTSYFNISTAWDPATKHYHIAAGVNVTTFGDTTAAVDETTHGVTLADAATFKHAIDDVRGTLVVADGDKTTSGMTADASALLSLRMNGGNTSIMINGSKYAIVGKGSDASTLNIDVKASKLEDAAEDVDGLAIASDVSTVINDFKATNASEHEMIRKNVGLSTENYQAEWTGDTALAYGADTSVIRTIELLDTSFRNASIYMNRDNTDQANMMVVDVEQHNGRIDVSSAGIELNGSTFLRAQNASMFRLELYGDNITLGEEARWGGKNVQEAVVDLSTMIENISTNFLKTVTGETGLTSSDTSVYVHHDFVAVTATATEDNNTNLDTSLLLVKAVFHGDQTESSVNGLATDGYVKDSIVAALMWDNY